MKIPPKLVNQIRRIEFTPFEPISRTVVWAYPLIKGYEYRYFISGSWKPVNYDLFESKEAIDLNLRELVERAEAAIQDTTAAGNEAANVNAVLDGSYLTIVDRNGHVSKLDLKKIGFNPPPEGIPKSVLSAEVIASLNRADTALQAYTEVDPSVPAWAREATKPSYSYNEIEDTPTNVSTFTNDSKYVVDEGDNYTSIIKGFGAEDTILATDGGAGNGVVNVNPGGVNIISNWSGSGSGEQQGNNNIYLDTSQGKALYNGTEIATKVANDLTNYYLKSETYTKTEVQNLIAAIKQFTYQTASTLPTASADTMHIIYLVPSSDPQTQNVKDEYITIDNGTEAATRYTWEQIGSTAIDLSGYVQKSQTVGLLKNDGTVDTNTYLTELPNGVAHIGDAQGSATIADFDANKVKITDGQGTQVFPITHESAVLDDNGNSAGQKFEILHDLYEALTQSNLVVVESEDWPLAELEERTIYRVAGTTSYTDYMYDGSEPIPMATYDNAIDDEPAPESNNLVRSGGVAKVYGNYVENVDFLKVYTDKYGFILWGIKSDGGVYYGAGVPQQVKDALDTKMDGSYTENDDFVYVITAGSENNILFGIKKDGNVFFGCGVPKQVKDYIEQQAEGGTNASTDILYFNPEIEIIPKIQNLKRSSRTKNYNVASSDVLCLLHFSDVHANNNNILRISRFYEKYKSYINDVIHTGDVALQATDGMPGCFEQTPYILQVVGNHEATVRIGVVPNHHWETVSSKTVYDFMMAPNIDTWGVTQPANAEENGYCYYYKDYVDKHIRLIVLDNMQSMGGGPTHWDATQKLWFENVLSDARTNSLHVIVALHYPPFEVNQDFDNNPFTAPGHTLNSSYYASVEIPNAVKDFIDVGGNFVCYLCGHIHDDIFGFGKEEDGFENQFVMSICCAGVNATQTYTNLQMKEGTKMQDCFDIVGVDTNAKIVKCFRVGAEYDLYMRKRGEICVNYEQSKIIYAN